MEDRPTPRPGNVQRAEWRRKCRQVLADHLRENFVFAEHGRPY